MGNLQSSKDWDLIGRESEVEKGIKCLHSGRYNCLQITGLKKIGKSRILFEVYKSIKSDDTNCLYKDFQYYSKFTPSECYRIVSTAFGSLTNEKTAFLEAFSEGTLSCNACEHCKNSSSDKKLKCLKWVDGLKVAVEMLINYVKESEIETILFLDNVDKLMDANPDIKTIYLNFLKGCRSERFKIVISSSKKASLVSGDVTTMEIEPLKIEDIIKLLYITTDGLNSDKTILDINELFSDENEVFIPENRPCLKHIARLCDGLPLAAIMSGSILMEYDNMISPVELLEILTQVRMKTLSPDNCPPDDRLDIYKREMEAIRELDEQFTAFFRNLDEQQQPCEFSIQDALSASADKSVTRASMKNDVLKKLLDRCVISVRKMSKEHQWRWHGILREANAALSAYNDVSTEPDATNVVMKYTKENARLIGLDLDDDALSDPKEFESAIRRLVKLSTEENISETECVIETAQGTIVAPELLRGSSQNNLSIDDNDVHENTIDIINNRTDNVNMNIRIPTEHCMQNDSANSLVTNTDESKVRNTKLDNIDDISVEKIINLDMSTQNLACKEPQQTTPMSDKTMSYHPCMSVIQREQANKLVESNGLLPRNQTQMQSDCDTLLRDNIRTCEDHPHSSSDKYKQSTEGNKRQNRGGPVTHTQWTGFSQINTNESTIHKCCEMKHSFNKSHSPDLSKLPINLRQESCDSRQNDRLPFNNDRDLNRFEVCPNRVDDAQTLPNSEYSNSDHHIDNRNIRFDVGTNRTCHLETCPIHGKSLSEHSDCSFTGPPGLTYNPPPDFQRNPGNDYLHLCVSSLHSSSEKCSRCEVTRNDRLSANKAECNKNPDLTSTTVNVSEYDSECGHKAMLCDNYSNEGSTQQQRLPNTNEGSTQQQRLPNTNEGSTQQQRLPNTNEGSTQQQRLPNTNEGSTQQQRLPNTNEGSTQQQRLPNTNEGSTQQQRLPNTNEGSTQQQRLPNTNEGSTQQQRLPNTNEGSTQQQRLPNTNEGSTQQQRLPNTNEGSTQQQRLPNTNEGSTQQQRLPNTNEGSTQQQRLPNTNEGSTQQQRLPNTNEGSTQQQRLPNTNEGSTQQQRLPNTNEGSTQQQRLPNSLMSQTSSTDTSEKEDEIPLMNFLDYS